MQKKRKMGKIITFYSFKGGVGRTMAVANIGLLAALNGKRVLVMDWDLEAPGLAYYFRGLLDSAETKSLREAPGILDFAWEWSSTIKNAKDPIEISTLRNRFSSGDPFSEGVKTLLATKYSSDGGTLDFIGSGRRIIDKSESLTYEDALSRFSWSSFFENEAGGILLENLRLWAKKNYDLILIDSRTGLADVAGICTMQLPDIVAMCFILNRQNIDGIAKISSTIRVKRSEEIRLHAVPMRVSRGETSEESDARARATSDLIRIGGFSAENIHADFRNTPIAAVDNVPFYESLSPFYAVDPKLDPLTLNYLRLANHLLGYELPIPNFNSKLIETAVQRLAPRNATVEYITKLRSSEPTRALSELRRLLDSALDTLADGGTLDNDYVSTLIDVTFSIDEVLEEYTETLDLQTRGLDLLRSYLPSNAEKWRPILLSLLQKYLETFGGVLEIEEEQQLEEEIDILLLQSPTVNNQLKRVAYRRAAARRYANNNEFDAAKQVVGEYLSIARELTKQRSVLNQEQTEKILAAEVDSTIISGDALMNTGQFDRALQEFQLGLGKVISLGDTSSVDSGRRNDLAKLRHDLHFRVAGILLRAGDMRNAAQHAIDSLSWAQSQSSIAVRFLDLSHVILESAEIGHLTLVDFCEKIAQLPDITKFQIASYNSRISKSAMQTLNTLLKFCSLINPMKSEKSIFIVSELLKITDMVFRSILRRRKTFGEKQYAEMASLAEACIEILNKSSIPDFDYEALEEASKTFKVRPNISVKRKV